MSAPTVVWEGADVRVLSDGSWEFLGSDDMGWLPGDGQDALWVHELARALAEAKRAEAAALEGNNTRREVLAAERKKAAESMRERAEELAYRAAALMKNPSDREPILALGHRIRDLPLKEGQ
ncbi:hypothetical protein Mx9_p37 [Myxococcus phage Mx9]|nr:hypothetical protein Mx9_p37 [Myxococcus phage Mx9]